MRVSNQVAVTMYEKLGYSVYRRVLEYYSGDVDEDAFGEGFFCLSFCLCLSVCLSISMPAYLPLSTCLSICLYLSVCLSDSIELTLLQVVSASGICRLVFPALHCISFNSN